MLRGTGATSSVIQAAGAPGGGVSARPNALVVLVKTNRLTPGRDRLLEQVERAGDVGVDEVLAGVRADVRLVQRRRVDDRVDAASTARTSARSAIEPATSVYGEARMSSPTASIPSAAQRADQPLAQVAGAARDEDLHSLQS